VTVVYVALLPSLAVKAGITGDLPRRLRDLGAVALVDAVVLPRREDAIAVEALVHAAYAEDRIGSETYAPDILPKLLATLRAAVAAVKPDICTT
jgi:hypothetical protein